MSGYLNIHTNEVVYENICERVCATFDCDDKIDFIQPSENGNNIIHVTGERGSEFVYEYESWLGAYLGFAQRQIADDIADLGNRAVRLYLGKGNLEFLLERDNYIKKVYEEE